MHKILVVDDEPQVRKLLRDLLKTEGYAVDVAADGVEALEQLGKQEFDLMLLDIQMPRMNGLEVLARLRGQPASPKVVVLTADDTPETVLKAICEQAYHYFSKPFEQTALLEAVRVALQAPPAPTPMEVVSARPDWVELLVPCELGAVDRIQSFLEHLKADLPGEVRESVGQAFRELLLNAIEWGGELDPRRKVRIAFVRSRRMLMYRIADPGKGFRVEDLAHAAVSNPPDQPAGHLRVRAEKGLRPGGFGLLMARQMVDELIYNEAHNEVVLIKYLDR